MTTTSSGCPTSTPAVALEQLHILAEGPVWDPIRERLLWVDLQAGTVYSGILDAGGRIAVEESVEIDQTAGAVAVAPDGSWLIAGREGLIVRSPAGLLTDGPRLLSPDSCRRLNDGKVDPAGRFLVGSLSLTETPSRSEILVAVDHDGTIRVLDDDLTLSNGLAWSTDGSRMFSVDTLTRSLFHRDYDSATGATGERKLFVQIADGYPDGITIDAEDHVWVAVWGAGRVDRYSPRGDLVATIDVPAPHTSSVAFAGPSLSTLVITTATQGLDDDELLEFPDSGRIFTCTPGVPGVAQAMWTGPGESSVTRANPTSSTQMSTGASSDR